MDFLKSLPYLPFDNLYKFLSLAGLAILIVSILFPYFQYREAKKLSIEAKGEEAKLNVEFDVMNHELDLMKQKLNVPKDFLSNYPGGLMNLTCGGSPPPEMAGKISCDEAKILAGKFAENSKLQEQ